MSGIVLSDHAVQRLRERFAPEEPYACAARLYARAEYVGRSRGNTHVVVVPGEASMVVEYAPNAVVIVTVEPAGWPVEVVGTPYNWRGTDVPASRGSLHALTERYGRRR